MVSLSYANVETPVPEQSWRQLSDDDRLALVAKKLGELHRNEVIPVIANENGQIFVTLTEPLPAARRGPLLLDIENALKLALDPGLVLWLEPMGDRNSLRNLRGIEVKK